MGGKEYLVIRGNYQQAARSKKYKKDTFIFQVQLIKMSYLVTAIGGRKRQHEKKEKK